MKIRNFLVLVILGLAVSMQAQDYKSAIGLRLGFPLSVSYKTFISEPNALEFIVGFRSYTGYSWVNVGGLFQHHLPISSVEGLSWYVGGGVNAYFYSFDNDFVTGDEDNSFVLGISGNLGLDYKFPNTPLNLSLDWVPTFTFSGYKNGFGGDYFGLAVRYVIK